MTREEVYKTTLEYFKGDDLKTNIWLDKYCLRNGDSYLESTPEDMFKRLAKEFARIESKYSNPLSYETIISLFKNFEYIIPGGSMLYGIGNNHSYSSLGNCFVIGDTTDSYGSICKIDEEQAQLMKRRGGVGHDLSHLRPRGSFVSNAANTSTGAVSFMHRYSNTTREVGQDGRRGALMLTMSVDHPDIEDFITAKDDLTKVTGANISVKVTDTFMNNVKDYSIFSSEEGKKATSIWNKLIHQAWKSAEPGVLFWDTIKHLSPADKYKGFESISTNPCGEIPLCAYDTCRLMSINMFPFVKRAWTSDPYFDDKEFVGVVAKGMRLMDDAIDLECEKIDRILNKIKNEPHSTNTEIELWEKIRAKLLAGRRTGLSVIGLGDTLAAMGIRYGSDKSITFCNTYFKLFHDAAYATSELLAQERGAFPVWDSSIDPTPRRNIALLTIPPSGTISILADVTSGIEPVFNLSYTRRRKVEHSDNVAFVDKTGDKWEEYTVFHPKLVDFGNATDQSVVHPWIGSTANEINPIDRVRVQAAVQRWIDHSISSTINLPKETTEEQIAEIYMTAWELCCKGITVYREGCRDGVLINKDHKKEVTFEQHDAPKRPKSLDAEVKEVKIKGQVYSVLVGMLDNKPYEVFVLNYSLPYKKGVIIKNSTGSYSYAMAGDKMAGSFNVTEALTDEQKAITRLVSTALRHGADIKFIVEQLNKTQGDLTSFNMAIARVLKQYIKNGSHLKGSLCPVCQSTMVLENGCEICKSCGNSRCA